MQENLYAKMKAYVEELQQAGTLFHKKVILFGHCEAAEKLLSLLEMKGIAVYGIVDNNEKKHGTCVSHYKVKISSPEELLIPYQADAEILIVSRHYNSMAAQLCFLGYKNQIHQLVNYDSFSEFSLTDEMFQQMSARVWRGFSILTKMRTQIPYDTICFLCPYPALGDAYMAMTYLPEYMQKHAIKKAVVVVVGDGCRQVVAMFAPFQVIVLQQEEMDELVQAVIFTEDKTFFIVHHDRPYTNVNIQISNHYNVTFRQHYCYGVFGLEKEEIKTRPVRSRKKEQFFFEKGNTVIVSPYAKSVIAVQNSYWKKVVKDLKEKGFHVLTNTIGQESPLEGTSTFCAELVDMADAVEYAGYFIGVRSGLCEVISEANCVKIVIYPDSVYSSTKMKLHEFFKLEGVQEIVLETKQIEE